MLVTVLYLSLDFSNPFIGGAFTFNASDSIEAAANTSALDHLVVLPPTPHGVTMSQADAATPQALPDVSVAVAAHRPSVARRPVSHPRPPARPPSSDDH